MTLEYLNDTKITTLLIQQNCELMNNIYKKINE